MGGSVLLVWQYTFSGAKHKAKKLTFKPVNAPTKGSCKQSCNASANGWPSC
jgi:hypothetical protein